LVVDIVLKREPAHKVISKSYRGGYTGDNMLRSEFEYVSKWITSNGVRSGKWFRIELDKYEIGVNSSQRRWWACIEVQGKLPAKPPSDTEVRTLPSAYVASVTFDPSQFSDRLVYHGLECWLDWRTKFGEYEEAAPAREVYLANPWTNKNAKRHIELQAPIRKVSSKRIRR
jgi:DNA gyrase inhibitor GyrI